MKIQIINNTEGHQTIYKGITLVGRFQPLEDGDRLPTGTFDLIPSKLNMKKNDTDNR